MLTGTPSDNSTAMTEPKSAPKRHHFVPKFYLRNFSDHKKRVRMYARGTEKKPIVTSVNNAAVESGFYTTTEESGETSQAVEELLSRIEGLAKAAIARMLKGQFPPDLEDRSNLSLFMALQLLRTPEHRRGYEARFDYTLKVMFEDWNGENVRERLKGRGIEPTDEAVAEIMEVVENLHNYRVVPHQNEHMRTMLNVAGKVAPVILERSWLLGHSQRATFVTSDHPVVWRSEPSKTSKFMGIGVGNADEVYFPLDRHHALAMALPDSLLEGRTVQLNADAVLFVNSLEAAYSYKWVYQHPDDDSIIEMIPDRPRPLMEINQKAIFED